jgi:type VI secretion system secreted protein Hcp
MFLRLDGITGESSDPAHRGEIEIQEYSWGLSNTGSGTGGSGKASPQDFSFALAESKASPNLMLFCATGKSLGTGQLTCRRAGVEILKIRMADVFVRTYATAGATADDLPRDQVTLNFDKIDFLYTSPRTGETVETRFNFISNTQI